MGTMFLGQQFMQNVLGYSTMAAAPRSAGGGLHDPGGAAFGQAGAARVLTFTLLLSFAAVFIAFVLMLLLSNKGIPYSDGRIAYIFLGVGVGLGGTPSSTR